jgi:hypothetical protein
VQGAGSGSGSGPRSAPQKNALTAVRKFKLMRCSSSALSPARYAAVGDSLPRVTATSLPGRLAPAAKGEPPPPITPVWGTTSPRGPIGSSAVSWLGCWGGGSCCTEMRCKSSGLIPARCHDVGDSRPRVGRAPAAPSRARAAAERRAGDRSPRVPGPPSDGPSAYSHGGRRRGRHPRPRSQHPRRRGGIREALGHGTLGGRGGWW